MKNRILMVILPVLACFALLPQGQATCEDGCNNGLFNVWQGDDALISDTTGAGNTALGWRSLFSNTDASFSTAVGGGALVLNNADSNTAVGAAALLLNTDGTRNVAVGTDALVFNDSGFQNTAVGAFALFSNVATFFNTAIGDSALAFNDIDGLGIANQNTAVGFAALNTNIDGFSNSAFGTSALSSNQFATLNTAIGVFALAFNDSSGLGMGNDNTAVGGSALFSNIDGFANVAIGEGAVFGADASTYNTTVGFASGQNLISGSDNIYIGESAGTLDNTGVSLGDETDVIRIGSVFAGTAACFINGIANNGPFADTVTIDRTTGQLGGLPSSARFKKDIEPMGETSEAIYSLKPVTFHYKNDKTNTPWFGLIAEDVAKVNPALIGVDKEGKPYCVAYDKVNAMLLNEFLKEHKKVEEQQASIAKLKSTVAQQQKSFESRLAEQHKQIDALTSGLQKVSAQLEMSKPAAKVVVNEP